MLAIERRVFGDVAEEVAGSLQRIGQCHLARDEFVAARKTFEESLSTQAKLYGDHDRQVLKPRPPNEYRFRKGDGVMALSEPPSQFTVEIKEVESAHLACKPAIGIAYQTENDVPTGDQLARGKIDVVFQGEKLRGGFALVRTGVDPAARRQERWLLVKRRDEQADPSWHIEAPDLARSVLSGRTLKEIAEGRRGRKRRLARSAKC